MPSSSIVISPTPVSWTMRTTSRMRSCRAWSTPPAASDSSPPERSRIARSSGSASSPKSASSSSSSSLAASAAGARRAARRGRPARSRRRRRSARPRATSAGSTGPGVRPKPPVTRSRSSSTIVEYRFAVRTFSSACEATIWPIGAASGGEPTSARTLTDLVEHLVEAVARRLRRAAARRARRRGRPAACAARRARRRAAASGETGSSPMCSSTRSDASQRRLQVDARCRGRPRRAPARPTRPRRGASSARRDRRRSRSGRRPRATPRSPRRARCRRRPARRGRPAGPRRRAAPATSSLARCGCRSAAGSLRRMRAAPSSGSRFAASTSASWRPLP